MKEKIITVGNVGYTSKVIVEQVTLRDQFAMAALGGINVKEFKPDEIAWLVYQVADAMLEARK